MIRRALVLALLLPAVVPASSEAVTILTVSNLSTSDSALSQTGRLAQDGVPSGCSGPLKLAPSLTATGSTFLYRNHSWRSRVLEPVCFTVDISTTCSLFSVGYLGGFDPANPLDRYAADMGQSSGSPVYSFVVPGGSPFNVIVHEVSSCGTGYSVTFSSRGPWAESAPAISGTPAVGSVLTGSDADWVATPAVGRSWRRCDPAGANCVAIPGATGTTYTVTAADLGRTLTFHNSATDADATHSSQSEVVDPFIPFESRAGESLAAGDRVQNGVFVRNGVDTRCAVPNAVPTILQEASSFLYDVFPVTSLVNEPVCLSAHTTPACVTGVSTSIYDPVFTPAAGLAANYAGNSGEAFNGVGHASAPLPGGASREVVVHAGSASAPCPSYGVTLGADAPFALARPALSGTAAEGGTLTASDGSWSGLPAFATAWLRCDAAGAGCAAIPGAAGSSYTAVAADVGSTLRARVTATQGRSASSDSAPSAVVTGPGADAVAPRGTVRLGSRDLLRALRRGRVPVRVRCDEACSAVVALTVSRKLAKRLKLRRTSVLARASGNLPASRTTTLRARLTRAARRRPARRALRGRRSVSFRLAAAFTDAAGNRSSARPKAMLKRPRRPARGRGAPR